MNADLFAEPPRFINPPPSDRYLDRFNRRNVPVPPMRDPPDDYHELPWQIRRFVDSICAPFAYDPIPAIKPETKDDDGGE